MCDDVQMSRVNVKPQLSRWARERGELAMEALARRLPKLEARISFTESFPLLGVKKIATFQELRHSPGVAE